MLPFVVDLTLPHVGFSEFEHAIGRSDELVRMAFLLCIAPRAARLLRHELCEERRQLAGANRWFAIVSKVVWRVRTGGRTGHKEKVRITKEANEVAPVSCRSGSFRAPRAFDKGERGKAVLGGRLSHQFAPVGRGDGSWALKKMA